MWKVFAALLGLLCAIVGASAQEQIKLTVGEIHDIQLRRPMSQVIVANEGVVRAEPVQGSDRLLRLRAEKKGQTTVTIQDASGAVFLSAIVTVGSPERIITIISKNEILTLKNAQGRDFTRSVQKTHDEWTYRCDDSRCLRFAPRNRPLDESQPDFTPSGTNDILPVDKPE